MSHGHDTRTMPVEPAIVLDPDVICSLHELAEGTGGHDRIVGLIDLFLSDAGRRLEALSAALVGNDVPAIRSLSHSLAGSSANLGAAWLAAKCRAVELDAFTGPGRDPDDVIAELRRALDEARLYLRREFPPPITLADGDAADVEVVLAGSELAVQLDVVQSELRRLERRQSVGFWWWDATANAMTVSPDFAALFGLDPTFPVTAAGLRERIHPDDLAACDSVVARATVDGRAVASVRVIHPDHSTHVLEIRAERIETGNPSEIWIAGITRDQTGVELATRRIKEIAADGFGPISATGSRPDAMLDRPPIAASPPPAVTSGPSDLVALVGALDQAIANQEFALVFQPKVSLLTNRIVGFEALIRWDRPGFGPVDPAIFIPVAEASGRILQIGEWVLAEASRQLADWQLAYPTTSLTIAINVSACQFGPRLCDAVRTAVSAAGIDASSIWLELTETMVMDDIEASLEVLDELRRVGVNISLDDFGTGHSSMAYLHRMPIDELKIDRSFVNGLGENSVDTAIVASVVNLAHAMGCNVIAEGVESPHQLEKLRSLGCDAAQGYLIARPLTLAEVHDHLAADVSGERWPRLVAGHGGADTQRHDESVLIVDDAADIRTMANMSLSAAGYTIHEAGSAGAAIALATRINPDCVVLDISMPDMSGIDVCKALRANPGTANCTIVMLSSHADGTSKAEAFLLGADDYLVKPFTPRDLIARVSAALRRRREMTPEQVTNDSALLEMLRLAQARAESDVTIDSEAFSDRQLEIMRRLVRGERVPGIARHLYLSQSTVRNHLSTIYRKLGVGSQEELLMALRGEAVAG